MFYTPLFMSNDLVVQHNLLTMAKYDYTPLEKRIMIMLAKLLNDNAGTLCFALPIAEAMREEPDNDNPAKNHLEVKKAALSLLRKTISIVRTTPEGKKEWVGFNVISAATCIPGTGIINISVCETIAPYYNSLLNTGQVTRMHYATAMGLKLKYSPRFYEYCCRFKDTGIFRISFASLREHLLLDDRYTAWQDFKKRVLVPAMDELKENADVYFEFPKLIKTGKLVTHFEFQVINKGNLDKHIRHITGPTPAAAKYYNILTNRCKVHSIKAHIICEQLTEKEIYDVLEKIQRKEQKQIKNIGAYTWAAYIGAYPKLNS